MLCLGNRASSSAVEKRGDSKSGFNPTDAVIVLGTTAGLITPVSDTGQEFSRSWIPRLAFADLFAEQDRLEVVAEVRGRDEDRLRLGRVVELNLPAFKSHHGEAVELTHKFHVT
jgi:hypothetical protein